jgi:DNA-binding NarL/FixJ family response regulator
VSSAREITVLVAAGTGLSARVRDALAAAGMVVAAECATAAEAIETAARERPDVCVLDRELPGGALAAAAAITSPRQAPKVLVVGGHGSEAERRAAILAGATDYLPGEPDGVQLAAAVAATETRSSTRALSRPRGAQERRT